MTVAPHPVRGGRFELGSPRLMLLQSCSVPGPHADRGQVTPCTMPELNKAGLLGARVSQRLDPSWGCCSEKTK